MNKLVASLRRFAVAGALTIALPFSAVPVVFAKEPINTFGSADNIAISGLDTVAFFTKGKATPGDAKYSYIWKEAKWLFSSAENLALFKASPEKYAPQWGGYCAVGVSEGRISKKPVNGAFDIRDGKLYLFPVGRDGSFDGIKKEWNELKGGASSRVPSGDKAWPELKAKAEAGEDTPPKPKG